MKVLALNSSPHKENGNTALILNPFLDGIREEGGEVELFYVRDLKINPCLADYACQLRTPGKCIQDDDMRWLLPKILEADLLVWASPLYTDGVSATMKLVMDRVLPGAQPFLEVRDDRLRHVLANGTKPKKFVLISNCGFWELGSFDPLVAHMKAFCGTIGAEYSGAILRPHGPMLKGMLAKGAPVDDVLNAAKEAGRQIVSEGKMSDETLRTIGRPLLTRDAFIQVANKYALDAMKGVDAQEKKRQLGD